MIAFTIYAQDRLETVFRCWDGHFGDGLYWDVYEYLTHRFGLEHEEAESAVSWCELACIGECYEGDGFEILIEEDD